MGKKDKGVELKAPTVFYIVDDGPGCLGWGDDESDNRSYSVYTTLKDLAENVEDGDKVVVVTAFETKTVVGSTIKLV
jgi:hypothetical protein